LKDYKTQHGLSVWSILVVLALLVGGAAYKYNSDQTAKREAIAADERSYTESLAALTAATTKFDDALKVAQSSSRISLAGPVGQLQTAMRETESLKVHTCLAEAQDVGVKRMKELLELFFVFMRNGSEVTQKSHAQAADKYLWDYMAKVKICADSRPKT